MNQLLALAKTPFRYGKPPVLIFCEFQMAICTPMDIKQKDYEANVVNCTGQAIP